MSAPKRMEQMTCRECHSIFRVPVPLQASQEEMARRMETYLCPACRQTVSDEDIFSLEEEGLQ